MPSLPLPLSSSLRSEALVQIKDLVRRYADVAQVQICASCVHHVYIICFAQDYLIE